MDAFAASKKGGLSESFQGLGEPSEKAVAFVLVQFRAYDM
jgi:hypothetical protein